jgi:predicted transcriptional regulator
MKKTTTLSFSVPVEIAEELDKLSSGLNISRSALITAILTFVIKWKKNGGV